MRNKEVVSIFDGAKLGWVCDVELDTASASMTALVIYGRPKLFGLLGREEDIVIPWDKIRLIGDDTVLVDFAARVTGVSAIPVASFARVLPVHGAIISASIIFLGPMGSASVNV